MNTLGAADEVIKEAIATGFDKLSSNSERTDCIRRIKEEFCTRCGDKVPEDRCRCH